MANARSDYELDGKDDADSSHNVGKSAANGFSPVQADRYGFFGGNQYTDPNE